MHIVQYTCHTAPPSHLSPQKLWLVTVWELTGPLWSAGPGSNVISGCIYPAGGELVGVTAATSV